MTNECMDWTCAPLEEMGQDMRTEWIIDVLVDLKAFAEHNGMDATVAGLEDATLVALAEIASLSRAGDVPEAGAIPLDCVHDRGNVTDLFAFRGQV